MPPWGAFVVRGLPSGNPVLVQTRLAIEAEAGDAGLVATIVIGERDLSEAVLEKTRSAVNIQVSLAGLVPALVVRGLPVGSSTRADCA